MSTFFHQPEPVDIGGLNFSLAIDDSPWAMNANTRLLHMQIDSTFVDFRIERNIYDAAAQLKRITEEQRLSKRAAMAAFIQSEVYGHMLEKGSGLALGGQLSNNDQETIATFKGLMAETTEKAQVSLSFEKQNQIKSLIADEFKQSVIS